MNGPELGLALWGAVLSTVLAAIKVMEWRAERRALSIKASRIFIHLGRSVDDSWLQLTATNTGKRPVTVSQAVFILSNRDWIVVDPFQCPRTVQPSTLPCKLEEGDDCRLFYPLLPLAKAQTSGSRVVGVAFVDNADRVYRRRWRVPKGL